MRRRGFILGFAAGAVQRPVTGVTQTASPPVIACLVGSSKVMGERYFGGFLQGMRELGYSEGQNWTFESRFLDGDVARASLLAEELPVSAKRDSGYQTGRDRPRARRRRGGERRGGQRFGL